MLRKIKYTVILTLSFVFLTMDFVAQGCVQCRTQIESSQQNDLTVGNGINAGITILMISPYILLAAAFYFIFGKRIKYFLKDLIGLWKN